MRHIITLAALVLLFTAAWVSWGGHDGRWDAERSNLRLRSHDGVYLSVVLGMEALDGDVARLIAYGREWRGRPDMWVAAGMVEVEGSDEEILQEPVEGRPPVAGHDTVPGEVVDEHSLDKSVAFQSVLAELRAEETWLITLEEATAYYGVEEFRDALIIVRFEESSNIVTPCVVGLQRERGPYQFMAGTWLGTPYAHLDPCDLEAATWAAAWKVSQPGGREAWRSTWPR